MKKVLTVLVVALGFVFSSTAQEDSSKNSFGFTAGFTSLNARGKVNIGEQKVTDSEAFNGFYIGVFKEFYLSEKLSIVPEFQFANYHGQASNDSSFSDLVLPVMLHYHFGEHFNLFTGLRFDYLLPEDSEVDNLNEFGLGLQLGGQWDIGQKWFVQLSASLGLTERVENDTNPIFGSDFIDVRTQTFNVGFGYRL